MKRLCAIVLISLLTTTVRAGELAGSFKQAADLAEAQDKIDTAIIYQHRELMPYYEKNTLPSFRIVCNRLKAAIHRHSYSSQQSENMARFCGSM